MYRIVFCLILLFLPVMLFAEFDAANLEKVDQYRQFDSAGFSFVFKITDQIENSQESTILKVYVKEKDKALVKYLAPEEIKNQFILMTGKSFWMLELGMKAPVRLNARTMLFGTASAGDVTRILFSEMYTVEKDVADGNNIILTLEAKKSQGATYQVIELTINKDTFKPITAECYSSAGIKLKTLNYLEFSKVGNKEILTSFEIIDEVAKVSSIVELSGFTKEVLPDQQYNRNYMKNLKPE